MLRYQVDLGYIELNPLKALAVAQSMGAPNRYAALGKGYDLFADRFQITRDEGHRELWNIEVEYTQLDAGQNGQNEDDQPPNENPLLRPPVFDVDYISQEYVIRKARNVEILGDNFQSGGPYRDALTLGPIVNGASIRPDEPLMDTERNAVIVIRRNYKDLGEIMQLNEDYARTCNSDSVTLGTNTIAPRRLKYMLTSSEGRQFENGVRFFPGVTQIEIKKTTDLVLDNVGFHYYLENGNKKRATDSDGEPTAEPINLELNGRKRDDQDNPTQITYRYLEEAAYAGFFAVQ